MIDPILDTAESTRRLLRLLPEYKRGAAEQLLDLPVDYVVCGIVGDCSAGDDCYDDECEHDREPVGEMTAGRLLRDLVDDVAHPTTVWQILLGRGLTRPTEATR